MKKFNFVSWFLKQNDAAAVQALPANVQLLALAIDQGARLLRSGQAVLIVHANGEVERIEGLVPELQALIQAGGEWGEPLQALWQQVLDPAVQLAQTATPVAPVPADAAPPASPTTTDAAPAQARVAASTPIAKVAEVFGIVQVVRNGEILVLSAGADIFLGDVVSTQANSRVKLQFNVAGAGEQGNSALIGDQSKVTVNGQVENKPGGQIEVTQINLKVDGGTVNVDRPSTQEVQVQVTTPSGRVEVPQVGVTIAVQAETGQTAVAALQPAAAGTGPIAAGTTPTIALVAPDSTLAQIPLTTTPQVVQAAPGFVPPNAQAVNPAAPAQAPGQAPAAAAPGEAPAPGQAPAAAAPGEVPAPGQAPAAAAPGEVPAPGQAPAAVAPGEAPAPGQAPAAAAPGEAPAPGQAPAAAAQLGDGPVVNPIAVNPAAPVGLDAQPAVNNTVNAPVEAAIQAAAQPAPAPAPQAEVAGLVVQPNAAPTNVAQADAAPAVAPVNNAQVVAAPAPVDAPVVAPVAPVVAPVAPVVAPVAPVVAPVAPVVNPSFTSPISALAQAPISGGGLNAAPFSGQNLNAVFSSPAPSFAPAQPVANAPVVQASVVAAPAPLPEAPVVVEDNGVPPPVIPGVSLDPTSVQFDGSKVAFTVNLTQPTSINVEAQLSLRAFLDSGSEALLGDNDFNLVIPAGVSSYTVTLDAPANLLNLVQNVGLTFEATLTGGTNTLGGVDAVTYAGASQFTSVGGIAGVPLAAPTNGQPLIDLTPPTLEIASNDAGDPVALSAADIVELAGPTGTITIEGAASGDALGLTNAAGNPLEQSWFRDATLDQGSLQAYTDGSVTVLVDPTQVDVGTQVTGGSTDDSIKGGVGNDTFDGGDGVDTLNLTENLTGVGTWSPVTQGLSVNLATGELTDTTVGGLGNDTILNIENIVTGAGADSVVGSNAANVLTVGDGNNTVDAGAGDDTIIAGIGNDSLLGGGRCRFRGSGRWQRRDRRRPGQRRHRRG